MKRFKVMGLCLAAVFALCAVVAASASAEPTYKTCIKAEPKNSGEYSEKTCATASKVAPGTGKYARAEWNAGKKLTFKAKNIGSPHNNIVNPFGEKGGGEAEPAKIEGTTTCAKEKVEGSVTSPENTTWKTTYKKCEALASKCNTAGEKEGTIVTDQLESTLVRLGKTAGSREGIRVKGLGPGGRLAQYECVKKRPERRSLRRNSGSGGGQHQLGCQGHDYHGQRRPAQDAERHVPRRKTLRRRR